MAWELLMRQPSHLARRSECVVQWAEVGMPLAAASQGGRVLLGGSSSAAVSHETGRHARQQLDLSSPSA
jgi:hypothetical protein